MDPLLFSTIAEVRLLVAKKKLSPVELVKAHIERIEKLQPQLNAFAHFDPVGALAAAGRAEKALRTGERAGSLCGVPLSVKSSIDVAGWPCPAGSLLRKGYLPGEDAPLVARIKRAGGILLGNTNSPEFLMAYESDNRLTGKTSNPWSLAHSAGGSSGGEAAAIASGCSMGGVGSDGGGSIRVPAHFCGIAGLKPTPGRLPTTGHFPPGVGAFAWIGVVGPMARSISDLRILYELLRGADPGDPLSIPWSPENSETLEPGRWRVGLLESEALGEKSRETELAVSEAARILGRAGARIEKFTLRGLDRAIDLWWFFFGRVIGHLLRKSVAGKESLLSPLFSEYLAVATARPAPSAFELIQACADRDSLRADLIRQMDRFDLLLSPVSSGPAFLHGEGRFASGTGYRETMRYSQWLNLAGFPGLSLPMGESSEGLPIGVQLVAKPFEEATLLGAGELLESARGPWKRPPELSAERS